MSKDFWKDFTPDPNWGAKTGKAVEVSGPGGEPFDDSAPPWETPTWASDTVMDNQQSRVPLSSGVAAAAKDVGMITETEHDYISAIYREHGGKDPDDPRKDRYRTRLERVLGFHDHRGKLMNTIGVLETFSGFRFLVSASAAITEGLKDQETNSMLGGFGLAWSTEEFSKAWHGRAMYRDVIMKGGADPDSGWTMAAGIGLDILLDPATWLTFGIGAGAKITLQSGSKAATTLSKNLGKTAGKKAAAVASRGGDLTLTRWGELVLKEAARDFLKETPELMYKRFGVKSADDILPEHVGRLLDDGAMRAGFLDFAIGSTARYEKYALKALEFQRAGKSVINPLSWSQRTKKLGGWTPRSQMYKAKMASGPAGMFQETASIWSKESSIGLGMGIVGGPMIGGVGGAAVPMLLGAGGMSQVVGGVLGAGFATTRSPLLKNQALTEGVLSSISKYNSRQAERLSRGTVPPGLGLATRMTVGAAGVAHGGIARFRNYFTSALERAPAEDRLVIQGMLDNAHEEMAKRTFDIRSFFNKKIERKSLDGRVRTSRITGEERIKLSHHIEDPAKHPIHPRLAPAAKFIREQFDEIYELEKEMFIHGNYLKDYVTHLYSSSTFNNILDFLKIERPGAVKVSPDVTNAGKTNPFSLHRRIATLDDALIFLGPNHVELDIARILSSRWNVSARMRTKKALTYQMWDKYAIGGMKDSLIMELGGWRKLLNKARYYQPYLDLGAPTKASKQQYDQIDRLAADIAEHDLKVLSRRGSEQLKGRGKNQRLELAPSRASTRKIPIRQEGSRITHIWEAEGGKLMQGETVLPLERWGRIPTRQGAEKTKRWFQKHPDKDELKEIRRKRLHKSTTHNRELLSYIVKEAMGVNYGRMTAGEAQFLTDFLKAHVKPITLFDAGTGKWTPHGWFHPDGMSVIKIEEGKIARQVGFFEAKGVNTTIDLQTGKPPKYRETQQQQMSWDQDGHAFGLSGAPFDVGAWKTERDAWVAGGKVGEGPVGRGSSYGKQRYAVAELDKVETGEDLAAYLLKHLEDESLKAVVERMTKNFDGKDYRVWTSEEKWTKAFNDQKKTIISTINDVTKGKIDHRTNKPINGSKLRMEDGPDYYPRFNSIETLETYVEKMTNRYQGALSKESIRRIYREFELLQENRPPGNILSGNAYGVHQSPHFGSSGSFNKGQIWIRPHGWNVSGANSQTLVHELVHAGTVHVIEKARHLKNFGPKGSRKKLSKSEKDMARHFDDLEKLLLRDIWDEIDKLGREANDTMGWYGKKNVDEMVAEAFTNKKFQRWLKTIQVAPSDTGWTAFLKKLGALLGLKPTDRNALVAIFESTDGLMKAEAKAYDEASDWFKLSRSALDSKVPEHLQAVTGKKVTVGGGTYKDLSDTMEVSLSGGKHGSEGRISIHLNVRGTSPTAAIDMHRKHLILGGANLDNLPRKEFIAQQAELKAELKTGLKAKEHKEALPAITLRVDSKHLTVTSSNLPSGVAVGMETGFTAYLKALQEAQKRGLGFASDTRLNSMSRRIYEKLQEKGIPFVRRGEGFDPIKALESSLAGRPAKEPGFAYKISAEDLRNVDLEEIMTSGGPASTAYAAGRQRLVPVGREVWNVDPSMSTRIARDVLKRRHSKAKSELASLERRPPRSGSVEDARATEIRMKDSPSKAELRELKKIEGKQPYTDQEKAARLLNEVDKTAPALSRGRYSSRQISEVMEDTVNPKIKKVSPHRLFETEKDVISQRIRSSRKEARRLQQSAKNIMDAKPEIKGTAQKVKSAHARLERVTKALAKTEERIAKLEASMDKKGTALSAKIQAEDVRYSAAEEGYNKFVSSARDIVDELDDLKAIGVPSKKQARKIQQLEARHVKAKVRIEKAEAKLIASEGKLAALQKKRIETLTGASDSIRHTQDSYAVYLAEIRRAKKDISTNTPSSIIEEQVIGMRASAREYTGNAKNLERDLAIKEGRYVRGLEDMSGEFVMPKSIVQSIDEALSSGFDMSKKVDRAIRSYQSFQKVWKVPLTLPFMGYWGRNLVTAVGLTANAVGFAMLDPRNALPVFNVVGNLLFRQQYMDFGRLARGLPKGVRKAWGKKLGKAQKQWEELELTTVYGDKVSVKEITEQAIKRGVNHGFVYSELVHEPFRRMDGMAHGWMIAKPAGVMKNAVYSATMVGETLTDVPFRVTLFTQEVLKGKSYAEAAESVKKYLNDYSRLSPFEKKWMRTFIPFYSWTQFSLEHAFKLAYEKPGHFLAPFKATREISAALTADSPPDYAPQWINERLGIWSGPNEHGYYTRLQGFAINQEEALRQVFAMRDLANAILAQGTKAPIVGGAIESVFNPAENADALDQAPLRFLAQMDFGLKAAAELVAKQEFFSGAPIKGQELMSTGSRLEAGRGFSRADDPEGILENTLTVGGLGGKWMKSFLEYTEKGDEGERTAKIDPFKRWMIGQTPISRFVSSYERHVKASKMGEVSYKQAAAAALGIHVYRLHPTEQRYYRDKTRIAAVTAMYRQAHLIDNKIIVFDRKLPGADRVDEDVLAPMLELQKQMDEQRTQEKPTSRKSKGGSRRRGRRQGGEFGDLD